MGYRTADVKRLQQAEGVGGIVGGKRRDGVAFADQLESGRHLDRAQAPTELTQELEDRALANRQDPTICESERAFRGRDHVFFADQATRTIGTGTDRPWQWGEP